jgi:flavin-dependent dehydrogenase
MLDPRAPWEKPCGGGLTAAALRNTPELNELSGETEKIRELLVVAPSGASVVLPLRAPYETISRARLSEWGLDRARSAGARFRRYQARTVERDHGRWRVVEGSGETHHGRWLVAADGATSPLRGQLAPRLRPELAPLRVAYPRRGTARGRAVFQFLPGTEGYLWDFPRPDHHSVGIGVPPHTFSRGALDGAIDQYRISEVGDRDPVQFGGAVIASSNWSGGGFNDLGGPDYALLGDAGGLADPATGEGIDYALRSATIAVAAFGTERGFDRYPRALRAAFGAELRRARLLRSRVYRPEVGERLVRRARQSARGAFLLMSLVDAVNEHRSLRGALLRGLFARIPPQHAAHAVCECPDGEPLVADPGGERAPA